MTTISPELALASARPSAPSRVDRWDALALFLLVVAFIALAADFLPHQSIWIDESTQLSGIAMGPGEVLTFLTGGHAPIGVPPDRSPPLSYWAGQLWSAVFGFSTTALRAMGIICVAGAITCTYLAARRFGRLSAILAAGFLAFSPTVITLSVEIRAYPLFLLLSAASLYVFLSLLDAATLALTSGRSRVGMVRAALVLLLIATIYTHFFGVILAGAILTAWLADALLRRQSLKPPLLAGILVIASVAGMLPFIHAAKTVSGAPAEETHFVSDLLKLPVHLMTHLSMRLNSVGSHLATPFAAALAAAVVALAIGAYRAATLPRARPVLIAAATGLLAVVAAAAVVKGFNPLAPNYNTWLLPPLAVLIGLAASERGGMTLAGRSAAFLFLAAAAFGSVQLLRHSDSFAHGPENQIFALIEKFGTQNVTVIQDLDIDADAPAGTPRASEHFAILFPLRYQFGPALQRYSMDPAHATTVIDDNQRVLHTREDWIVRQNRETPAAHADSLPMPPPLTRYVIVIRSRDTDGKELIDAIKNVPARFGDGPAARAMSLMPAYRKISSPIFTALVTADVDVFERK